MKRIGILIAVLAVLIGGYTLIQSYPKADSFEPPASIRVNDWTQDNLEQVTFSFSTGEIIDLTKDASQWKVNTFTINQDRLQDLFDAFAIAEITSRVSTNAQNHARFEVAQKATRMTLKANGEVIQELLLGKTAGGESIYVRIPEDDSVYVLNGIAQYIITNEEAIWRNREIVSLDPTQIRSVQNNLIRRPWKVAVTEAGWVAEEIDRSTNSVDEEKTLSWLAKLRAVQAIEFPQLEEPPAGELGSFTVEEGSLSALTQSRTYQVYEAEDESQLLIQDENEVYYAVQKDQFDALFTDYPSLLDELSAPEPETEE